jgi:hypothetical protein
MFDSGTTNSWWRWRDGSNDWQAFQVPTVAGIPVHTSDSGFLLYGSANGFMVINDDSLELASTGITEDFLDSVEVVPGFSFMGTRDSQGRFTLQFSNNFEDWSTFRLPGTSPVAKGSLVQFDSYLWLALENEIHRLKLLQMDEFRTPTPVLTPFEDHSTFSWHTVLGYQYRLEKSANLTEWQVYLHTQGTGDYIEVTMPPVSDTEVEDSFYRIRQTLSPGN